MTTLNEADIEQNFIELLEEQGYKYFYGPDIAPYWKNPQRENFDSVILEKEFKKSLKSLNPNVPESAINEAYQNILNLGSSDLMANNEKFHNFLTDGISVEYLKDWKNKTANIKLIDFENIENNSFWVVNQFVIKENNNQKRLDLVIFVNGLPLVISELKNPTDEKATLEKAYTQIQNYKKAIPTIFYYNALCIISDGLEAKTSSLSAPFSRFLAWKSPDKKENGKLPQIEIMAKRMLNKQVLLNLIKHYTVFEQEEKKDKKTWLLSVIKVKKIAAYHQYYAVEKAVKETLKATHEHKGNRKIGIIWHTQGSWKSLSMVFYVWQIVIQPQMQNPTVVVLTDRNDLDNQLFNTFWNCKHLLRQTPVQAENKKDLKELLKVAGGGIIFTTIQKFSPNEGNVFETLSERSNIVVIADEAHRSQYWFKGKIVETENGSEIKYWFAKYLRDALPNASFIWFTGTPIEKEDKSTRNVFWDEIDIYDIRQAVDDKATVPINYESRLVKINFNKKIANKIDYAIDELERQWATKEQIEKAKKKNAQINAIVGHPDRLKEIAKDIVHHFEERQKVFEGKAMVVCMTRQIAVNLYNEIIKLRPNRHSDNLMEGAIKVVMTSSSDDPESFQPHHTTKEDRKKLAVRFKDINDPLKIVIVQSMWLTGFDVPCLHTMYIDKKMQGANLMQAIARVNRVYKDKPSGLIVDYIGIGQDLRNAMGIYTASGWEGEAVIDIEKVIEEMETKFEVVQQMFYWFDYKKYFKAKNDEKLKILFEATNFILQNEKLKNRFLKEVTALSKLFAMAVPSFESEQIRDEVAFFQAVKAHINKLTPSWWKTDKQVETSIKQIVDEALVSDGMIDIFKLSNIKNSLDILSDKFLLEVKNMKQKNIAFELLKKLLNDEIKIRKRKNIIQWKKFSEMLENSIKRYHNNQIDTAQIIQELIKIADEMKLEDKKAEDIGLSPEEYAFYSVLSENKSTKFLEDHKMKELIHVIVNIIRKNATVDWEKREDVRAKLRVTVKKILMKYGYPPDLARMEADKVLEQGELLASELTK